MNSHALVPAVVVVFTYTPGQTFECINDDRANPNDLLSNDTVTVVQQPHMATHADDTIHRHTCTNSKALIA